ncbi:MAG: baseplate J/gp47 family protein [Minicystis sp.]
MTATTYLQATTTDTEAAILASLMVDLGAAECDTAGLSAFSAETILIRLQARALVAAQDIRARVARTIELAEAAKLGRSWLDKLAKNRYQEVPIPAQATRGMLPLTTAMGAAVTARPYELLADGGGGVFFRNTTSLNLAADATTLCEFECTVPGTLGNVVDGAIAGFQRGKAGLSCINLTGWKTFVGRDVETDVALVSRCIAKWGTLGAGWTRDAINYLIPTLAPSVTRWKVLDANPTGPGSVKVIAANAAGGATGPEIAALLAGLGSSSVKPLGAGELTIDSATELTITVAGTMGSDGTNASILVAAKAALDLLRQYYPIGGGAGGKVPIELLHGILTGGAYVALNVPGFAGSTGDLTLTAPLTDSALGVTDVPLFVYAGLTVA